MKPEARSMQLPFDVQEADRAIASADRAMAGVIEQHGPCKMTIIPVESPFEALFKSIIYQQLSTQSATAIYNRVLHLFDTGIPSPEATLKLSDEALRGAGMSRQKIAYMRDLASKSVEGIVPGLAELDTLSDQEILERLTAVHGIGRWTVEMLLMFSMGRPDILPSTDLGIRKGFQEVYAHEALPKPRQIETYGERWRPYRTIASWYLWRVVDGDNEAW